MHCMSFFPRLTSNGFHCLFIFLMMSFYFGCISFIQVCTFPLYLHCTMRYSLHEIMLPTLPTDNAIWNDGWNCVKFKVKQYYILNAHVDLDLSFEDCLWIQTRLDARSSLSRCLIKMKSTKTTEVHRQWNVNHHFFLYSNELIRLIPIHVPLRRFKIDP